MFLGLGSLSFNSRYKSKNHLCFGRMIDIPKDALKLIPGLSCSICGNPLITPQEKELWLKRVCSSKGEELAKVIEHMFLPQIGYLSERKVAVGMAQIIKKSPKDLCLGDASYEIMRKANRANPNRYIEELVQCIQMVGEMDIPEKIRRTVLSVFRRGLKRYELGGDMRGTVGYIDAQYKKILRSPFERGYYAEIERRAFPRLNLYDAVRVFFDNPCLRSLSSKNVAVKLIEPFFPTYDHIVPKSDGGTNNLCNYLVMHKACNVLRDDSSWRVLLDCGITTVDRIINYIISAKKAMSDEAKYPWCNEYLEEIINRLEEQTKIENFRELMERALNKKN